MSRLSFLCFECGGRLEPKGGETRTLFFRGRNFIIPSGFLIPTCVDCGADFLDDVLEEQVKAVVYQL